MPPPPLPANRLDSKRLQPEQPTTVDMQPVEQPNPATMVPPCPAEMELLGLTGAYLPDGEDAMPVLRRLASRQEQLGMWAAPSAAGKPAAAVCLKHPSSPAPAALLHCVVCCWPPT